MVVIPPPPPTVYGRAGRVSYGRHWTPAERAAFESTQRAQEEEARRSALDQPPGTLSATIARTGEVAPSIVARKEVEVVEREVSRAPAIESVFLGREARLAEAREQREFFTGIGAGRAVARARTRELFLREAPEVRRPRRVIPAPVVPEAPAVPVATAAQALMAKRFLAEFGRKRAVKAEEKISEAELTKREQFGAAAARKYTARARAIREAGFEKGLVPYTGYVAAAAGLEYAEPWRLGAYVPKEKGKPMMIETEKRGEVPMGLYQAYKKPTALRKWTMKAKPGEVERYEKAFKKQTGYEYAEAQKEVRHAGYRAGATVGLYVAAGPILGKVTAVAGRYVPPTVVKAVPTVIYGTTVIGGRLVEARAKGIPWQEEVAKGVVETAAVEVAMRPPVRYRPFKVVTPKGEVPVYRGLAVAERPVIGIKGRKVVAGVPQVAPELRRIPEFKVTPVTAAEARIARKALPKIAPKEVAAEKAAEELVKTTRGVKSIYKEPLPKEVRALKEARVKEVYKYAEREPTEVFGTTAAAAQMPPGKLGRLSGDIDIAVRKSVKATEKDVGALTGRIKEIPGRKVRVTDTTIETKEMEKWHHAVQLKSWEEAPTDVLEPTMVGAWGRAFRQPTVRRGKIELMGLSELAARKRASVFALRKVGKKVYFAPEEHRIKDIKDMITHYETLAKGLKGPKAVRAEKQIGVLKQRFAKELVVAKRAPRVKEVYYPARPKVYYPVRVPAPYKYPEPYKPSMPPKYKVPKYPPYKPPTYKPPYYPPYKPPKYPPYKPPTYKPPYYPAYKPGKYPPYMPPAAIPPVVPGVYIREMKLPRGVGVPIRKGYTASLAGIILGKYRKTAPRGAATGFGVRLPVDPAVVVKKLKKKRKGQKGDTRRFVFI